VYTIEISNVYTHLELPVYQEGEKPMYLHGRKNHHHIRDFRAHLKDHLSTPQAFSIGTVTEIRAIIVPTPYIRPWQRETRTQGWARAAREFKQILKSLRDLD